MSAAPAPAPIRRAYCKRCDGEGMLFVAEHMTNPSARMRWETCDRCDGNGLEPLLKRGDEDGDT